MFCFHSFILNILPSSEVMAITEVMAVFCPLYMLEKFKGIRKGLGKQRQILAASHSHTNILNVS